MDIKMIEKYSYLWDGSEDGWALLWVNSKSADENPAYSVVNTITRRALLITDGAVEESVVKEMLARGRPVVSIGSGF
jgi:hypothetical protein